MSLLKRLARWLDPEIELIDAVRDLTARVEDIEAQHMRRELELKETRDQIARHLSRVAAIEQRARQRGDDAASAPTAALLAAKFSRQAGG